MAVSGIDDWYLDYAHRHELTPGFSRHDDIPDPYVPGEVRGRERAVATRKGGSSAPVRRYGVSDGLRVIPPADRGGTWESAALKWWKTFSKGTNRECQRALREAGHGVVSTQLIARLRRGCGKPGRVNR